MGDGIHMPEMRGDCSAFCGHLGGDVMRVFVYFTYKEYHSIRKWMQRHQEYEGAIFSNDGFYIAKFDIDATDPQKVAYFFNYFAGKNVEIFKPKKLNPYDVLKNYEIVSYKPFTAYPRHDEDPSHTVFPEGGNLRPPSQSGRSSDEAELATVGRASPHPGMRVGSNPTAPTHEKEVEP